MSSPDQENCSENTSGQTLLQVNVPLFNREGIASALYLGLRESAIESFYSPRSAKKRAERGRPAGDTPSSVIHFTVQ